MSFKRITAEEIAARGVVAAPDKLTGKAADNKAVFDRLVKEIVTTAFNGLLDALEAQTGAAGIGAAPFENVAGTSLQGQVQDVQHNHEALRAQGGAEYVGAEPFGVVLGTTVQRQLRELLGHHEALQRGTGAAYIGAAPFNGVPSGTVQGQLMNVQQNVDDINAGLIPQQSVTMDRLGLDVVERIEAPAVTFSSGELDDYTAEIGTLTNAGAGWNTQHFQKPFEGVPVVAVTPQAFSGWVEVKDVTAGGFLYCLRRSKLNEGSADRDTYYLATGSGTNPNHTSRNVVTGVTFPTLTTETVSDKVTIGYIALEYGGER